MHRSTRAIGAVSFMATAVLVIFGIAFAVMPLDDRASLLGVTICKYRDNGILPDRKCTPGLVNPIVRQSTIRTTICVPGWTAMVRPPSSKMARQKRVSMDQYMTNGSPSEYEYDHLIPLELGGALSDPRNLWPEPRPVSYRKDAVENKLKRLVCEGSVSLSTARTIMRTDWRRGQ